MKKLLISMLTIACLAAFAGVAAGLVDSDQVVVLEWHVYLEDGAEQLIPQSGAEQRHLMDMGSSLVLQNADFPGFTPLEGEEAEVHLLVQGDETVVFHYTRTTAPVTATVRLEATAASNLVYLQTQLSSRRISLRMRQETVATMPLALAETEAADELAATLTFDPTYTHTLSGSAISYRVIMENPPQGFVASSEGLALILRPVPMTLSIRHLYEAGEGMEPIPQPGAEYDLAVQYGDTLLVPNQDFDGFLADQETPNQYVSAVTGELELTFFHRRRMGIYGQIEIDTSLSNRPNRLPRLLPEENPVLLSLHGRTEGTATAQFSGQEPLASVSFPNVYTHTPEGVALSYTMSLVEEPAGFIAWGDGTSILLTSRSVGIAVIHQYEAQPGIWEVIPQEGASYTERARFGDALTVGGRDFPGFAEDPEDLRELSQIAGEEEVIFQHVRAYGDLSCELRLQGGPDTDQALMLQELASVFFIATGGELPEEGVRVEATLTGEGSEYLLQALLPALVTHTPEGEPYAYTLLLRGFLPLTGTQLSGVQAGSPFLMSLSLPEIPVTCLLQYADEDGQSHVLDPQDGMTFTYPYGERVILAPPDLPGFSPIDPPLSIGFLTEAVTHTFTYQRDDPPTD